MAPRVSDQGLWGDVSGISWVLPWWLQLVQPSSVHLCSKVGGTGGTGRAFLLPCFFPSRLALYPLGRNWFACPPHSQGLSFPNTLLSSLDQREEISSQPSPGPHAAL